MRNCRHLILVVGLIYSVSGNAVADEPTPDIDWHLKPTYTERKTDVTNVCKSVGDGYRSSVDVSQGWQMAIAITGIVAGAVISPALAAGNHAKSVVAGVAGISGAVNGIQYAWGTNGVSASARAKAYKEFSDKINDDLMTKLANAPTEGAALGVLDQMEAYCNFPPLAEMHEPTGGDSRKAVDDAVSAAAKATLAAKDAKENSDRAVQALSVASKEKSQDGAEIARLKESASEAAAQARAAAEAARVAQAQAEAAKAINEANAVAADARLKREIEAARAASEAAKAAAQQATQTSEKIKPAPASEDATNK